MKEIFEAILQTLKENLSYWTIVHLFLANRALISNQVFLASIWYVALYWSLHFKTIKK
jgi:hypothetical protein